MPRFGMRKPTGALPQTMLVVDGTCHVLGLEVLRFKDVFLRVDEHEVIDLCFRFVQDEPTK
jgi:hypothetical protein